MFQTTNQKMVKGLHCRNLRSAIERWVCTPDRSALRSAIPCRAAVVLNVPCLSVKDNAISHQSFWLTRQMSEIEENRSGHYIQVSNCNVLTNGFNFWADWTACIYQRVYRCNHSYFALNFNVVLDKSICLSVDHNYPCVYPWICGRILYIIVWMYPHCNVGWENKAELQPFHGQYWMVTPSYKLLDNLI